LEGFQLVSSYPPGLGLYEAESSIAKIEYPEPYLETTHMRRKIVPLVRQPSNALELRIELLHVQPTIYRRLLVPESILLPDLHLALQMAMGWQGYHLHEFVFNGLRFGLPDTDFPGPEILDERGIGLSAILMSNPQFDYLYDFGDGWEHRVTVVRRMHSEAALSTPICIEGVNACPPEDVGGVHGYSEFLEAIANPSHKEHRSMLHWCGGRFDPSHCDLVAANELLRQIDCRPSSINVSG
jgi:hypothetical protein